METIFFYSYKGGMGKSLAASNLALCLSRLGKNCALLDLDFDAPSLHNKFDGDAEGSVARGFVEYFWSHLHSNDDNQNIPPSKRMDDLKYFSWNLPRNKNYHENKKIPYKGNIHFIPAGDVKDTQYVEKIYSQLFKDVFSLNTRSHISDDISKKTTNEKYNDFIKVVKDKISELNPNPDYLLVDMRSGAHELVISILSNWIDEDGSKIVCMFSNNRDNLISTKNFLINLSEFNNLNNFAIIPTLSRVPSGISDFINSNDIIELLEYLKPEDSQDLPELSILHSEREIEIREKLYLGYYNNIESERRLTFDYLKLFSKLIREEDIVSDNTTDSENIDKYHALLNALDLKEDYNIGDRIFRIEANRGALINPNDNSRNVSFKVETFHSLLSGLEKGIKKLEIDQKRKETIFGELLKDAGKECGEKFGIALNKFWDPSKKNIKLFEEHLGEEALIRKWCTFDSDVGFGRFVLVGDSVTISEGKFMGGQVILRESFLTPSNDTFFKDAGEHKYCNFILGYITGVMSKMFNREFEVTHKNPNEINGVDHFSWEKNSNVRSESCIFEIECTSI